MYWIAKLQEMNDIYFLSFSVLDLARPFLDLARPELQLLPLIPLTESTEGVISDLFSSISSLPFFPLLFLLSCPNMRKFYLISCTNIYKYIYLEAAWYTIIIFHKENTSLLLDIYIYIYFGMGIHPLPPLKRLLAV
ncbi:hypothetical protein KFK09_006215 [Dendrobium nobile]|uniref:Uncharacterized protein n=1 Tax=Dendrobium nobile TaxID=94219 RepID=A0A8T3BR17_DENNO|nr:hypothetical protein KFK09_006215 [Dendrobium nobile]